MKSNVSNLGFAKVTSHPEAARTCYIIAWANGKISIFAPLNWRTIKYRVLRSMFNFDNDGSDGESSSMHITDLLTNGKIFKSSRFCTRNFLLASVEIFGVEVWHTNKTA